MSSHFYIICVLKGVSAAIFLLSPIVSYAEISFEKKVVQALAPVSSNEYHFSYSFKNAGDKEVKILKITTTCGCTKAESDKPVYAPGESGKIIGIFEIGDRVGRQDKKIYITTDDAETPKITLSLNLAIPVLAEFRPKMLLWRRGGIPESKKLRIDTAREYGARIVKVECADKNFQIDFVPQKENTDSCEVSIKPLSLEQVSKSEISLTCRTKGGSGKIYKVYALIR